MSWIQVNQSQTVEAAGDILRYRLSLDVTAASGIDRELFVFFVTDGAYSHVATISDLTLYPNNRADAVANDILFYRDSRTELVLSSQIVASNASSSAQARLARVNLDWGALGTAPFGGVETFIYDSAET